MLNTQYVSESVFLNNCQECISTQWYINFIISFIIFICYHFDQLWRSQHGAHLGPTWPKWAPCWTHELCYLGSALLKPPPFNVIQSGQLALYKSEKLHVYIYIFNKLINISLYWHASLFWSYLHRVCDMRISVKFGMITENYFDNYKW